MHTKSSQNQSPRVCDSDEVVKLSDNIVVQVLIEKKMEPII